MDEALVSTSATPRRPRLLQLAQKFSANPTNGAELRIYHLAVCLARHMAVTHLGFSPGAATRQPVRGDGGIEFVPVPREGSYRAIDLARGALGKVPFSVLNYTRGNMQAALAGLLEKESFDIVQLESVHLAGYLPILWNARRRPRAIVCDWHNIESEILARYSDGTASLARRLYARYSSRQLTAYERWFTSQCNLHIVVSERDRDTLVRYGTSSPILVIDNGVDVEGWSRSVPPKTEAVRFRVLFAGSMDYHANIDAVTWFARGPWPEIRRRLPDAVFTIAGRNPSAEVRALGSLEGVEITGTVSDLAPYYREALVAVVPLRVAGGTRIKILEAMAAGVPVISTARGAEGLAIAPGTHYILADRDAEMSDAVADLARDGAKRERLAAAAAALVRQKYDWAVLGDRLATGLLSLL